MENIDKYSIVALGMCGMISLTALFLKSPSVMWAMVAIPFSIMAISEAIKPKSNTNINSK